MAEKMQPGAAIIRVEDDGRFYLTLGTADGQTREWECDSEEHAHALLHELIEEAGGRLVREVSEPVAREFVP